MIFYYILKKRKNVNSFASTKHNLTENQTDLEAKENIGAISNNVFYENDLVSASIFLFGHFEVIDKNGNDITRQFSPLLKEMFLLILLYTLKDGKGISSDQLYEILWEDKAIKDARNNFSVNILKLKTILEKVGETTISKETGKWRFDIVNDSIKIDYKQFIDLANDKLNCIDKKYIKGILSIIQKGAFLREVQYNWIDDFKSTVSDFIVTTLLTYASKTNISSEPEFFLKITNCIFHFDQLNEEALSIKCRCLIILGRHALAKETYLNFSKEYKKNYGEEFTKSYNSLIELP